MKLMNLSLVLLLVAACSKGGEKAPEQAPEPTAKPAAAEPAAPAEPAAAEPAAAPAAGDPVAEARNIYDTRCVVCHGSTGMGDGPGAANLDPKPRMYSDKAWQASIDDEKIAKAIVGGGPAVGLSPLMPPNPDLTEKKAVVDELVKIVRAFGQ